MVWPRVQRLSGGLRRMRLRIAVGCRGRLFDGLVEWHLLGARVLVCRYGGHFILAFLLNAGCGKVLFSDIEDKRILLGNAGECFDVISRFTFVLLPFGQGA